MESGTTAQEPHVKLYKWRWVQLAYLSMLALLSDWVCFSVAAAPGEWHSIFMHSQAALIDIFLFTNVIFCFLEPAIVARIGLRKSIVFASGTMSLGCALRSGVSPDNIIPFSTNMPRYTYEVVGTILVGAAQPFFQCTPPLLSATWFSPDERVLATSVAINANQLGIATAFLVGGEMAQSKSGLNGYFSLISLLTLLTTIGAFIHFKQAPAIPPSCSAAARNKGSQGSFPRLAWRLLWSQGFLQPLVGFMASIGITNAISSFISVSLTRAGFAAESMGLAGAGFQFAIMSGSIVIGIFVDKTKCYKSVTMVLLVCTFLLLLPVGLSATANKQVVLVALLLLGMCVGPVQPICVELAVEVAYPVDESTIVAIQQVCGNLFSALTVPLLAASAQWQPGPGGFTPDYIILEVICIAALLYVRTLDAPLKRLAMDRAAGEIEAASALQMGVLQNGPD